MAFHLDTQLDLIAHGDNLTEIAFKLIGWAEAHGRLAALVASAKTANPGNALLREFGFADDEPPRVPSAEPLAFSPWPTTPVDIPPLSSTTSFRHDTSTVPVVGKEEGDEEAGETESGPRPSQANKFELPTAEVPPHESPTKQSRSPLGWLLIGAALVIAAVTFYAATRTPIPPSEPVEFVGIGEKYELRGKGVFENRLSSITLQFELLRIRSLERQPIDIDRINVSIRYLPASTSNKDIGPHFVASLCCIHKVTGGPLIELKDVTLENPDVEVSDRDWPYGKYSFEFSLLGKRPDLGDREPSDSVLVHNVVWIGSR